MSATFPIILSAPSGTGKTTIAKTLLKRRADIGYSVSCTTRDPRPGEVNGTDYYFLSRSAFVAKREEGEFAESAEVHGNLYETLRSEVLRVINSGKHVLMDIDVQGAAQLRDRVPDALFIFLEPPSVDELQERLWARGTDDHEALRRRAEDAERELSEAERYDHRVVNDDVDRAAREILDVVVDSRDENGGDG